MENEIKKKSMLSGIQPSGDLHLGNYLGAVKNWGARAEEFDCYYFMADLHTLTVRQDPKLLRRRSLEQLAQYIACGIDPEKNVLFLQSHVHEHAELGWILNCYTLFAGSKCTQFSVSESVMARLNLRAISSGFSIRKTQPLGSDLLILEVGFPRPITRAPALGT